jgi:hypothetical protein
MSARGARAGDREAIIFETCKDLVSKTASMKPGIDNMGTP